jgi:hypothetical protein
MSKHEKNKFKVSKPDAEGNELPMTIGKGIDRIQAFKAVNVRKSLVGCYLTESKKEQFKLACQVLDVKQSDVFNMAVNETIKKASE